MNTRENERALIEHLSQGDRNAFWALWEKHHGHLRHLCQGLLRGHTDDVEDVLSDTMLKAWEGLPRCAADIQNLRAWLARVAYRVCMDWWRDRGRTVHYSDVLEETGIHAVVHQQAPDDPQDLLMKREEYGQLVRVIGGLPPRLRDPLTLYVFKDKSYPEIASQLSISEANLRKRIQQARELLGKAGVDVTTVPTPGTPPVSGEPAGLGGSSGASMEDLAEEALSRNPYEIRWRNVEVHVVHVTLPSGAVRDYPIVLDYKPARREIRLETIRQYLERHPRGWKRRLELAQIHYASGEWQQAIEEYRRVLSSQPRMLDSWLRLGEMLRLTQSLEEARGTYEAALKLCKRPATQHYLRGQIALCDQRYYEAAEGFQAAANLERENAVHWHALARAHQGGGRPCEALLAYEQALALNADDIVALLNSREALLAEGRLEEAEQRLDRALALQPDCAVGLTMQATVRCSSGLARGREGQNTRRIIARALHVAPESAAAWAALAQFHIRRGEPEAGLEVLRDFTARRPQCPQGWHHYSLCLAATGDHRAAADAALTAHALHPRSFPVARWACVVLPHAGRTDDLRMIVDRLLADFPERWDTYTTAGLALAGTLGEFARACEVSAQAPQRQPQLAAAWLVHGEVLVRAGRPTEAMQALERGWELLPATASAEAAARAAFWMARCHHAVGRDDKARDWFEESARCARERVPADIAEARAWLGRALEALGDARGAADAYRAALANNVLHPEHANVAEGLKRVESAPRPRSQRSHELTINPGIRDVRVPVHPWMH